MPRSAILVSAASSLSDVFVEVGRLYARSRRGESPRFNFGASGALAQQVEAGAPIDVFVSASPKEVDTLEGKGLVRAADRVNFATNRLVLITSASSTLREWNDLRGPGVRRVAISNPDSVPSGRYGRETLQKRGLWEVVQAKALRGANVRQTLAYVAGGNADAGIVFATDAQIEKRVRVVTVAVPKRDHTPILYVAAIVAASAHRAEAAQFIRFLTDPAAQAVFRRRGFGPPP